MFSLITGLYSEYFSPQQLNLLVVGLSGSGKTTILERIKVTDFAKHSTTASTATATAHHHHHDRQDAFGHGGITSNQRNNENHNLMTSTSQHHGNEQLRSNIFLQDDDVEAYEAPPPRKRKAEIIPCAQQQPPVSKLAWICPPIPFHNKLYHRSLMMSATVNGNSTLMNKLDDSGRKSSSIRHHSDLENDYHYDEHEADHMANINNHHNMNTNKLVVVSPRRGNPKMLMRRNSNEITNTTETTSSFSTMHHPQPQHLHTSAHHSRIGPPGLPQPRRISETPSSERRTSSSEDHLLMMEDIDLGNSGGGGGSGVVLVSSKDDNDDDESSIDRMMKRPMLSTPPLLDTILQYDVKHGAKMLQPQKIRPTIGMNLAKTEICGAKVHVMDVGGKIQSLWERYYADADAVMFVWKLSRDDVIRRRNKNQQKFTDDNDSDDDEDQLPMWTALEQRRALEQVRSAVPDDIPFVIFGHLFQINPPYNCEPDVLYSTSQLLPHYHNPCQALFLGNAITGQGIKTALEWLISTAKRQQRIRERAEEENKI
jgi:GTPase SAR1 family protein